MKKHLKEAGAFYIGYVLPAILSFGILCLRPIGGGGETIVSGMLVFAPIINWLVPMSGLFYLLGKVVEFFTP